MCRNASNVITKRGWGPRKTLCVLVCGVALLSACERRADRVLFDGEYFRTKVSKESRDNQQSFSVVVPGISRNFEAARDSGRFAATRYCVNTFGTSDIEWISGPDDDPETLQINNDRLTLLGTCLF